MTYSTYVPLHSPIFIYFTITVTSVINSSHESWMRRLIQGSYSLNLLHYAPLTCWTVPHLTFRRYLKLAYLLALLYQPRSLKKARSFSSFCLVFLFFFIYALLGGCICENSWEGCKMWCPSLYVEWSKCCLYFRLQWFAASRALQSFICSHLSAVATGLVLFHSFILSSFKILARLALFLYHIR